MKAKIIFNLNDVEDKQNHLRCLKATDMSLLIWDFVHNSRKSIEWGFENNSLGNVDCFDGIEACFKRFEELLEQYNINVDELID